MDDLIHHIAHEVALRGRLGAVPSEVFNIAELYIKRTSGSVLEDEDAFPGSGISTNDARQADFALRSDIWRWLTQQPEISAGQGGRFDDLGLNEVEQHNDLAINNCLKIHENPESVQSVDDLVHSHCNGLENSPIIKLHANEEQIWRAVAGHGVDHARIPPRDFECLSAIARYGATGIIQPELIRVTGQDKRSVPLRTQRLSDQGYIVKDRTLIGGTWTSLLRLRRHVQSGHDTATDEPTDGGTIPDNAEQPSNSLLRGRYTKVEVEIRTAIKILSEAKLIAWDDMKRKLVRNIRLCE